jgi:hypothetical protein
MIRMHAYIPYGILGKTLNDEAEANSRLRSFQIVMDMQQESCMLKKFPMKELCKDSVRE